MGIVVRRVLDTLLLLETFATLLPGTHGSHLRQGAESPAKQNSRITQSFDMTESAIEGLPGLVVGSYLTKGVTPLQTRALIIGGTSTDHGEYPYFATTKSTAVCGASLIHPDILLTAAHCQKEFARIGVVYIGAHELDTLTTTAERRTLIRQYPHPDNHDLMLFQLDQPVDNIPVVTLNSDPDQPRLNSTLTAIGFGATSMEHFTYSDNLMAVDVYPVDPDTCARQYNETTRINPDTMLCAGHSSLNYDSCNGDSGGPLLDKETGEQVGIVSFGRGCGDPDFPGVYTRVSTYKSWIHDRICELSAMPPADCPAPNSDPKTGELTKVVLFIKYDNRPSESFWRLVDDATGQAVAFQPKLPEQGDLFSQELLLPPGKYTLHFTDTAGDGIKGKIIISADVRSSAEDDGGKVRAEAPTVISRNRVDNVLADSDGKFEYHLSLPFVVGSGGDGTYYTIITDIYDTGHDSHLTAILILVALSLTAVLSTAMTFVLRYRRSK
jgi:hypothetical protein